MADSLNLRLGSEVPTGLEIRDPISGNLTSLATAMFGQTGWELPASFNPASPASGNNTNGAWTYFWADDPFVTATGWAQCHFFMKDNFSGSIGRVLTPNISIHVYPAYKDPNVGNVGAFFNTTGYIDPTAYYSNRNKFPIDTPLYVRIAIRWHRFFTGTNNPTLVTDAGVFVSAV